MSIDRVGELEDLMKRSGAQLREMQANQSKMADVVGTAEGAEGRIKVTVRPGGRIESLELDPRALRLPSEDLAETIVATVHEASNNATEKIADLMESFIPGMGARMRESLDPEKATKAAAASRSNIERMTAALEEGRVPEVTDPKLRERLESMGVNPEQMAGMRVADLGDLQNRS